MHSSPSDPEIIGLSALAETLGEPARAQRFLDLTGIGTDELRQRAGDRALLVALLRFLADHEPDLLAVADGLGLGPGQLIAALNAMEQERPTE